MANDVIFKLSAEESQAVQAFLRVVDAQKKVEDGAKRVKDEVQKAGTAMEQSGQKGANTHATFNQWMERNSASAGKMSEGLGGMTNKIAGMGGAALVAAAAYDVMVSRLENVIKNAAKLADIQKDLQSTLANTGELSMLPGVREKLRALSGDTMNDKQAAALFATISQQGGTEMSMADKLETFGQAVTAQRAGLNAEGFAKTFAELRKGAFGNIVTEDLASITTKVLEQTGGKGLDENDIKFLNRSVAGGAAIGLDSAQAGGQALEMILAAKRGGEGGKVLTSLLEESSREIRAEDLEGKAELSAADKDRAKAIDAQRTELREKTLALEKQDFALQQQAEGREGGVRKRIEKEREKISLQQKQLSLQDADLAMEAGRINDRKVKVQSPEQMRLQALAELAPEERLQAMMLMPEKYAPASMQTAVRNLRANSMTGEIDAAVTGDLFQQRQDDMIRLEHFDGITREVNDTERMRNRSDQKRLNLNARQLRTVRQAEATDREIEDAVGSGWVGSALKKFAGAAHAIGNAGDDLNEYYNKPRPVQVINMPQPVREVVRMNGGNPPEY